MLEANFSMTEFWLGASLLSLSIGISIASWLLVEKRLVSIGKSLSNRPKGNDIPNVDKTS